MNTPERQREVVAEILRTRVLGGGSASVVGGSKQQQHGSRAPGPLPDETAEEWSRRCVEHAIEAVAELSPRAYLALNEVFNPDVGGYRDLEHYQHSKPEVAREAILGFMLVLSQLPAAEYPLVVRLPEQRSPAENVEQFKRQTRIFNQYRELHEQGTWSSNGAVIKLAKEYNCSPRRIYQIIEQMRLYHGEPKRSPGRPRKGA